MAFDIKGGLKNTSISHNKYVAFEELLSNAVDSYLIRRSQEKTVPPLQVTLGVEFFNTSLLYEDFDVSIWCKDNGAGFGDEQIKAFVTKDSTYKDYLQIQGIGKCKGAGRIQFFHYFSQLNIQSVYQGNGTRLLRQLTVNSETRELSEQDFSCVKTEDEIGTTITLKRLKAAQINKLFDISRIRQDYAVNAVQHALMTSFLQRFIVLKNIVGEFKINLIEREGGTIKEGVINSADLPTPVEKVNISVGSAESPNIPTERFRLTRYSLAQSDSPSAEHEVALCANSAIVSSLTKHFLRTSQDRRRPIDGKIELILIESDYLDVKVNVQRDGFDIPKENGSSGSFSNELSMEDIIEALEENVFRILTPSDFDREALISSTQESFGVSRAMLEAANIKIHYGDTEDNIAKRVLKKFQEHIVHDTARIVDLKDSLLKLDPRAENFREIVNDLSWKYTVGLRKMDMANLSQLVVRRSAMLEVLRQATSLLLQCQQEQSGKRQEHEKIIHNIFFPTGKDSADGVDHDIWILNEEYHYYEHIASDKALSSIKWHGENLFEPDIDESLEALFAHNNKEHHLKRPDIAIFNKEGAAIIIEFKAPGVPLQEHINDLAQYARLLAAKSAGRISRFFGYLIGDTIEESRMPLEWNKFPSMDGYFHTGTLIDPRTRIPYGELYSELLYYQHFIERAKNRLEVFRSRLNIGF